MGTAVSAGFDYSGLPKDFIKASRKRADNIRSLDKSMGQSVLDIGRLLKEQRDSFGSLTDRKQARGADTWTAWVKAELGWQSGRYYANKFIQIYEVFDGVEMTTSLGYEKMKMLAPEGAAPLREKVLKMAAEGNMPTVAELKAMKREHSGDSRPTPTEAKEKAKATGEPQIASDGRIYTPLPEDEAAEYEDRRDRTYGVIDAANSIAGLSVSPDTWLAQAEEHWLTDFSLAAIEDASAWLTKLAAAYRKDKKVIDNGK